VVTGFFREIVVNMFNKLIRLYQKHREVVSYLFFGGLTTLVSLTVRYSCYFLGIELNLAQTISWICAVTFAFFVNKIFVFRNKSVKKSDWFKQAGQFYSARLTTLLLELGFMNLTVRVFAWSEFAMILVVQVFILVGNYLLSKFWIFKKP
jgi:putative flippase GtrA